jgi:hypothetical protein
MTLAVCDVCGRLLELDNQGRIRRHDTVGIVVRARTGKRRKVCPGSGRLPRRIES